MKLFYVPGACSLTQHIAVRELDLPVQLERVDRQTKKTAPSGLDYKALNPKGYVPGLMLDDGQMLTENAAIAQYLADRRPDKQLAPPAGTLERYRLQEWLHFVGTELHKGVSPLFNPKLPDDARQAFKERVQERLGLVEKTLAAQPFLMGQQFTVADCYLYVVLSWTPRLGLDLAAFPSVKAYYERISQRPAVKAALEAERAAA